MHDFTCYTHETQTRQRRTATTVNQEGQLTIRLNALPKKHNKVNECVWPILSSIHHLARSGKSRSCNNNKLVHVCNDIRKRLSTNMLKYERKEMTQIYAETEPYLNHVNSSMIQN